jgi:hypothetical protein
MLVMNNTNSKMKKLSTYALTGTHSTTQNPGNDQTMTNATFMTETKDYLSQTNLRGGVRPSTSVKN